MQDGFIFSDTIADNIAISSETIDKKQLNHSVEVANIKEFIESLPLRYNTKIGQEGVGISQGQKQRILIARAVYKNPQYIFLDEATNALDANNEKAIMENLNRFFEGRTVVVVKMQTKLLYWTKAKLQSKVHTPSLPINTENTMN